LVNYHTNLCLSPIHLHIHEIYSNALFKANLRNSIPLLPPQQETYGSVSEPLEKEIDSKKPAGAEDEEEDGGVHVA